MTSESQRNYSLRFQIGRASGPYDWLLESEHSVTDCASSADLVYFLEKEMTIALQTLRCDLFFVHGAVIDVSHGCTVLVGESGIGKSTLAWELCNRGFAYMSDELAPIDPVANSVTPYPHAICLKSEPGTPFPRPDEIVRTSSTLHVPVDSIPTLIRREPSTLRNIVFLARDGENSGADARPIEHSEAAARLYANGLNQLAHANDGLAAAAKIVSQADCYILARSSISTTRDAVQEILLRQAPAELRITV